MQELAEAEAAALGKGKGAKRDGADKAKAGKPTQTVEDLKAGTGKPAETKRRDLTVGVLITAGPLLCIACTVGCTACARWRTGSTATPKRS